MKKLILVIVISLTSLLSFTQNKFQFELAGSYSYGSKDPDHLGNGLGARVGEYFRPFKYTPLFFGLSCDIIKYESNTKLYYPLDFNFSYLGNKKAISPIFNLSIGYGIYHDLDSLHLPDVVELKGAVHSSEGIGLTFTKWKSAPYFLLQYEQASFKKVESKGYPLLSSVEIKHYSQFALHVGFFFK